MELIDVTAQDIITLSLGGDDYDPEIDQTPGKPNNNPWAN